MSVTNDALYKLVNDTRIELTTKIDAVISGPINDLQRRMTAAEVKDATLALKVYLLVGLISSVVSIIMTAVVTAIVFKVLGVR